MKHCRVRGCGRKAHGFGLLCDPHWKKFVRHGEATQDGIRVADIKPYKKHLRKWIAKRKNAEAIWSGMRKAWQQCVDNADAELRAIEARGAFTKWKRAAWLDIVRISGDADRDEIILTVAAMGYLAGYEPRKFASDRALRFQIARRFRGLSDVNVAEHWNHNTGRVHRVYRDASRQHAEFLGRTLMEALGVHGLAIFGQEDTERTEAAKARMSAFAAITADATS